jgi:hypothetical protein
MPLMHNGPQSICIIERLTLKVWFLSIMPILIQQKQKKNFITCLIFDGSWIANLIAALICRIIDVAVAKFDYNIVEARDKNGVSIRLKIAYRDMANVQTDIINDTIYQQVITYAKAIPGLEKYLEKSTALYDPVGIESLNYIWNALLLVHVAEWKKRELNSSEATCTLFIKKRQWFWVIEKYAKAYGVELKSINFVNISKTKLKKIIKESPFFNYLSKFKHTLKHHKHIKYLRLCDRRKADHPYLSIEYYGHFNTDNQELYSDLFFWQQSALKGKDILLFFGRVGDTIDQNMIKKLKELCIKPIIPYFSDGYKKLFLSQELTENCNYFIKNIRNDNPETIWLKKKINDFSSQKKYWMDLFDKHKIKIYTHWYKYDADHIPIAEALRETGGVMALYQRSYEALPTPETTVYTDIQFSFSNLTTEIEKQNRSSIRYQVITGYLGDHRFPLLHKQSQLLRNLLKKNGSKTIYSFFDENTADDSRWFPGHNFTSENYAFILEQLLKYEWMGLVIKPKNPRTLQSRLGPVANLLEEARRTGRCFVYEAGPIQGSYPPAAAALASDIAIHEFLSSGTAGIESALCGIPTLLLDREGWPLSNLYALGVGKVVFTDWDSLWKATIDYRTSDGNTQGFGDWSPMLNEIDPFRDGKAANRMGTYLMWLLEGFKAGQSRETIMADAAERYVKRWGTDKVTGI